MSVMRGGRKAAEAALAEINPVEYARSRNFLDGAVTRLSPYLRHGVLTLSEVRDDALSRVRKVDDAEKFISELGWRDYWQRLYAVLGDGIWSDREAYKTGFVAQSYANELPVELVEGSTGLACMDGFSAELRETGYLHNHARMWMAAYVVHWLRVRWQAGARWFLEHLLDGDPASNNLSWQWVASTFSQKPYYFNRENLERYTAGRYCKGCPLRGACPLEGSYENLEMRLFPRLPTEPADSSKADAGRVGYSGTQGRSMGPVGERPLLWVHTDSLNPGAEMFARWPNAPASFVWDEFWLAEEKVSGKRVQFVQECLAEMPPMTVERGDVAEQVLKAASVAGADSVVAMRTPDTRLLAATEVIRQVLPVIWIDPPPFVDDGKSFDLKRFSRYWQKAKVSALLSTESHS
jgi:deoxyribodipyrimidine photo-lyase